VVIVALVASGRRSDARALAAFVPHCVMLLRRLLGDPRVSRRQKVGLAAALVYVAMPIDLVPEFIPVIGYADDAVVVALALRSVLRAAGPALIAQHWPGPERSLAVLLSLCGRKMGRGAIAWPEAMPAALLGAFGMVGLSICIWADIADNCSNAIACPENDPLLLTTGRLMAVALCVVGAAGLAAQAIVRRHRG
jgi:uncharacterized membrane protein YkvA (DUF1232 family)